MWISEVPGFETQTFAPPASGPSDSVAAPLTFVEDFNLSIRDCSHF